MKTLAISCRGGFTIVEAIVAIFLFTVTTLFATNLYIQSIRTQENSIRAVNAALLAREAADQLSIQGAQVNPAPDTIIRGGASFSRRISIDGNRATITISWKRAGQDQTAEFVTLLEARSARS